MLTLGTPRLHLRPWTPDDYAPFRALNADPDVMRFFPACLSAAESDAMADEIIRRFERQKAFGLWVAEEKSSREFTGFVGLNIPSAPFDFSPCPEIGWRLAKRFHVKGYATEAANAVLHHAFMTLTMPEIVAFTAKVNLPSERVMVKTGMRYQREFLHPSLEQGHPLQTHVLYKITQAEYRARQS